MELNVLDFPTPQAALDAARDGDTVYFPGNIAPYQAPQGGFKISKNIEIWGDGPAGPGVPLGTAFEPGGTNGTDFHVLVVQPPPSGLERVRFRNFQVRRRDAVNPDGNIGILCRTAQGRPIETIHMERIAVVDLRDAGIVVEGVDLPGTGGNSVAIANLLMLECATSGSAGISTTLRNVVRAAVIRSHADGGAGDGWLIDRCAVALYQGATESSPMLRNAHMTLRGCRVAIVDAVAIENFDSSAAGTEGCLVEGAVIEGTAVKGGPLWLGGCGFGGSFEGYTVERRGVRVLDTFDGSAFIAPNGFTRVRELVALSVADGSTVLPQFNDLGGIATPGLEGIIVIPAGAMVAAATINRNEGASAVYSGLIIPSKDDGDPTWAVQNGMIYYDSSASGPRFRVRIANAWKTLKLGPPLP